MRLNELESEYPESQIPRYLFSVSLHVELGYKYGLKY